MNTDFNAQPKSRPAARQVAHFPGQARKRAMQGVCKAFTRHFFNRGIVR